MATTIREALESAVSTVEAKESALAAVPAKTVVEAAPVESVRPAAGEVPLGETEGERIERLRDEKGRFTEGKAEVKPAPQAQAVPVVPKLPKPDSWKKDRQADWDAMTPAQQTYVKEREDQYFKGISTYQQEWKGAKPLLDAVAPFLPELQKHNITPEAWITSLGRAHQVLATGDGQSKLQMFARLAQDYGVPLQALYDPAFAQQFVQQTLQHQTAAPQPQDINKTVREILAEEDAKRKFAEFERDIPTKYPHYDVVRPDMALLLDAGKAKDYPSAYSMALRLHDDLFAAEQAAKGKADEAARLEAQRKTVAAAKGSAVSVKSATPASAGAAPKKGIRSQLEDAYDQHVGGRV